MTAPRQNRSGGKRLPLDLVLFLIIFLMAGLVDGSAQARTAEQERVRELFTQAMTARQDGLSQDAIVAFLEILDTDPAVQRARLELAVTYAQILQYDKAMEQAQIVLDDPVTPTNVKAAIRAFQAQIEANRNSAAPRSEWKFPVQLSYIYDSNVNIGPSSTIIPGLGELNPNSLPQKDSGTVISAGINHTFRTDHTQQSGQSSSDLIFMESSGISYYARHYFNEDVYEGDYDLRILSARTGPALIARRKWLAHLDFQFDYLEYGEETLGNFYTLTPSLNWFLPARIELGFDTAISRRDYRKDTDADRKGVYYGPRLLLKYNGPKNLYGLQAAAQYFEEDADSQRFSNSGLGATVNGAVNITGNFVAATSYSYKHTRYDGLEPGFPEARDEDQHFISMGLAYTFPAEVPSFGRWTLGFNLNWTDNQSNIPTTDYQRTLYDFSLRRVF